MHAKSPDKHQFDLFLEFIRDYKNKHPDLSALFLDPDNLNILEKTIKNYKNVFFRLPDSDRELMNRSKPILQKDVKKRSKEDWDLLAPLFEKQRKIQNYQDIVDILNKPETFQKLFTTGNVAKAERIHQAWERNSHFAGVMSADFIIIIHSLDNIEAYIAMIFDYPDNAITAMVTVINKEIKYLRIQLLYAMLGRLNNAKQYSIDDVALTTLEAMSDIGLNHQYLENTRQLLPEQGMLSNISSRLFQDHILASGNKKIIQELHDLYLTRTVSLMKEIPAMPSFENKNMMYTVASGVHWEKCNFNAANLMGSTLNKASFQGSTFENAKLSASSMQYVNLCGVNLKKASVKCTDFTNANLQWIHAPGASFAGSIFQYGNLQGAILYNTDLQNADFSYADLRWANLAKADFKGIIIHETRFDNAQFFLRLNVMNITEQLDDIHEKTANIPQSKKLSLAITQDLLRHARTCHPEDAKQILQTAYQHPCIAGTNRFFGGFQKRNANQQLIKNELTSTEENAFGFI